MNKGDLPEDLTSDADLIAEVRSGDDAAYGELYRRHATAARSMARQLMHSESEIDDLVAETFTRVLDVIKRGRGPVDAFRPYLLTALRRTAYDKFRAERRQVLTDEVERYDPGTPFVDPAVAGLERSLIARAFLSLPERWQTVLWHTAVEGEKPAEVAPLLGLTPNSTAALAHRAREGLSQAYLEMHLSGVADEACKPALRRMGGYVRGVLGKRELPIVTEHLDDCADCRAVYAELADVNVALRSIIGPLIAGPVLAGYLAGMHGAGLFGVFGWLRHLPKRAQQGAAVGAAVAVVAAAVAFALTAQHGKPPVSRAAPATSHEMGGPPAGGPPGGRGGGSHRPSPTPNAPQPAPTTRAAPPTRPSSPAPPHTKRPAPTRPATSPAPTSQAPTSPAPTTPAPTTPAPTTSGPAPTPPAPTTPNPPRLVAEVGTIGNLVQGESGIITLSVRNAGDRTARDVRAALQLPTGVIPVSGGGRGSAAPAIIDAGDGWTCRPAASGRTATCTHGALAAGADSRAYLRVTVSGDAPLGKPPSVTISSGGGRVNARGSDGVTDGGLAAGYATAGRVRTITVGNATLSCPAEAPGCAAARERAGHRRDDDLWRMTPLDLDHDRATVESSAARLDLPGTVRWAGLYWSGVAAAGHAKAMKLRGPGERGYHTIAPDRVRTDELPSYSAYQGFANVTAMVREYGAGVWWGADVPTVTGATHYAGWSLVVIADDESAPYSQAAVLDSTPRTVVDADRPRLDLPLAGLLPARVPATIGVVAWEGDAGLSGDRLLLNGRPLRPAGGDREGDNVMDSASLGATGPKLTFGTDVGRYSAILPEKPTLSLTTVQDAYLLGAVTVTSPMRS